MVFPLGNRKVFFIISCTYHARNLRITYNLRGSIIFSYLVFYLASS